MNKRLKISDIRFGKIDAHNELHELGEDYYLDSFVEYEKYKIDSFVKGENYYICGNKGMGKTALMKYLECVLAKDPQNLVVPIRFKTDFDEVDRKGLRAMANNIREEVVESVEVEKSNSYVMIWQVFLINKIIKNANVGEYRLFEVNPDYDTLVRLLKLIYAGEQAKLIPKLNKGYVKVDASVAKGIDAAIGVEIEFDKKTEKVNFQKTAKMIMELFLRLNYDKNPVFVLIDELELSVKPKEHKRDIELVRDLILAVDKMNHISKECGFDIKTIASVRSEVINHVLACGYEINKCIEDYGVEIEWFQKGGSHTDSPLLKIIESKIHASEKANGLPLSTDVWGTYFSPTINDTEVRKYILSYSWQRPRDIIRMMKEVQDQWNGETVFSQEMFDRAMQNYSRKTWNEIAEELVLTYSKEQDIQAIKKFFTKIELPFSYKYLVKRAEELGMIYPYVEDFFKRNRMIDFLEKMYEWGVIGNSGQRMMFKFLGDRDLAPTENMVLHRPLRNLFAVQSRKNQEEDSN